MAAVADEGKDGEPVSEWREIPLGEVMRVEHGYAFKGEHFGQDGPTRLITPGNFHEPGGFRDRGATQKSYEGPIPEGYALSPGALVVAMTEQAPGLLGSSGLVPQDRFTWLHNQRIGLVRVRAEVAVTRFLYYLFNHPAVRAQIGATATGTKVRHTSPSRIESVRVRVPAPRTQERIAAVLSAFDELIEVNKRRIELLEDLARSLYREWFVRFRFSGHGQAGLVNSEMGPIPEGWTVLPLRAVAQLSRQSIDPSRDPDASFEHFSIPSFDAGALPRTERGSLIRSGKYVMESESVLLSKINPRISRVWFASPRSSRSVVSTEFLVWTGVEVSNAWLWAMFGADQFQRWLLGVAGGTSTSHQRVKPGDVSEHRVVLAPTDLRIAFDALATPALRRVNDLRLHNRQLAATRDLLLPRLVTGRRDISDVDLGDLLSEATGSA